MEIHKTYIYFILFIAWLLLIISVLTPGWIVVKEKPVKPHGLLYLYHIDQDYHMKEPNREVWLVVFILLIFNISLHLIIPVCDTIEHFQKRKLGYGSIITFALFCCSWAIDFTILFLFEIHKLYIHYDYPHIQGYSFIIFAISMSLNTLCVIYYAIISYCLIIGQKSKEVEEIPGDLCQADENCCLIFYNQKIEVSEEQEEDEELSNTSVLSLELSITPPEELYD